MTNLMVRLQNDIAAREERGAAMAEYGLLLALVALAESLSSPHSATASPASSRPLTPASKTASPTQQAPQQPHNNALPVQQN